MNMRGRLFGSISAWLKRQDAKGGQGKASIDTRLSGLGISCGQSSRRQKLAEIFEREKQDKTHMPTAIGLIQQQASRDSK